MKETTYLFSALLVCAGCVSGAISNSESGSEIGTVFSKPNSTRTYESTNQFKPLRPGQWTVLKKYEGRNKVIFKYSVYNDSNSNPWIEIQDTRPSKNIIIQYRVTNLNATSISGLGIVKAHYYMNDRQMDHVAVMMRTYLQPLFPACKLAKLNLTITTPGGIFEHVYGKSGSTNMNFSFKSKNVSISIKDIQSGTMFYHPALPMNGLVGWKSTKDNAEVVDFGFTGAEPAKEL